MKYLSWIMVAVSLTGLTFLGLVALAAIGNILIDWTVELLKATR